MYPQMPGIDRGSQRSGDQAGVPAGLYMQPQMSSSNKPQWPGGTPHVVTASREKTWQQQQQDLKHKEYLKQQQRLKAMGVPNNKNVSADALIGNLLEKKDTFRPKLTSMPPLVHGVSSAAPTRGPPAERAVNEDLPPWICPGSARLPPVYAHIWTFVVDPASGGTLVDTNRIFPLLLTSGLPTQVLGFIWNLAAQGIPAHGESIPGGSGQLTQQQLYVVLALVALAQTGCTFNSLSILKMLPHPPLPIFNMKAPQSESSAHIHGNPPVQAAAVPAPAAQPVPPSVQPVPSGIIQPLPFHTPVATPITQPVSVIPNTPIPTTPSQLSLQQPASRQEELFSESKEDDFTDFQSADVSSSIPTATVVQPSSAAKQVVNELNHSVITRLGNQGRSIGSRLANHTLGAPKTSRSHHKHHRSDRRPSMETPYFDDEVTFGGGRSRKLSNDNSYAAKVEESFSRHHFSEPNENDDFNDFQMAIGLNVNVDELFPKCKQVKKRTVLRESAIRNETDEKEVKTQAEVDILSFDSPVTEQPNLFQSVESPVAPFQPSSQMSSQLIQPPIQPPLAQPPPIQPPLVRPPPIQLPSVQPPPIQPPLVQPPPIQPPLVQPPTIQPPLVQPSPIQPPLVQPPPMQPPLVQPPPIQPPPVQPPPIQPPNGKELMNVQEDKYSALRFLELESTAPNPSDDFGDFVSADDSFAEIAERKSSDPGSSLFSSYIKEPEETFSEIAERESTTTGKPLFADLEPNQAKAGETTSAEFPVDDWLSFESVPVCSEPSRPALGDLSSIFSSLNVSSEPKSKPPQIEVSRNVEGEDEFGDFVGPDNMWGGDDNSAKLPATLSSDNRSINSFEMTTTSLSRQGSLPSLDLKLFPPGEDSFDKFKEGCVPINEWQKCLDCCVSLLQSAVNTFTSISSQDVVMEVLGTSEGRAYFINLKEVRYVYNRIRYSYYRCGQELNQIETSLKAAQQAWDSLERFYKLADIDTVDHESREENGSAPCCICCCPASAGALEYNGHSYHASCANLWLNCV